MKVFRFATPLLASLALLSANLHAADNIKVGVLTTLSGPASAPGIDQRDAINLAMKLLGNKLGGLPAELITVDDQFSPDAAKQAADRLLRRDKIDVLTGVIYSNVLLAVVPSAVANKTVVVSSNAGPAAIAGKECSPYFFSASWQNDATHEAAGKYMTDKGYRRVALIAPNYPAGKDAAAGFKRFFKGELASEMYPKLGQLDFAAEIAQIRSTDVDAIYYFLPSGMGVNFTKQYAAAGMSSKIARVFQAYDADQQMLTIGELIEGVVNTGQWSSDMDNEANKRFVSEFTKACAVHVCLAGLGRGGSAGCGRAQRGRQDRGPRCLHCCHSRCQGLQVGAWRLPLRQQPFPDPEPIRPCGDQGRRWQVPQPHGGPGA